MTTVLFVCTGNTCRSPMAESLLKYKDIPGIEVRSAGTYASNNMEASINTKKVLDENKIPHNHKSSLLTEELVDWADFIFTMTHGHKTTVMNMFPQARTKTYTMKEFASQSEFHDIVDPFGGPIGLYRETYGEIKEAVERIADRLKE